MNSLVASAQVELSPLLCGTWFTSARLTLHHLCYVEPLLIPLRRTFVAWVGHLRFVGPMPQLIASAMILIILATWDLCRLSRLPQLVASVGRVSWSPPLWDLNRLGCFSGRLRYVGPLSSQLVATTLHGTWSSSPLRGTWSPPLHETCVAFIMHFPSEGLRLRTPTCPGAEGPDYP